MTESERMALAAATDPRGRLTVEGAKAAFVRGEIDVAELERRIGAIEDGSAASQQREPD